MKITKIELKELIRECLREELKSRKLVEASAAGLDEVRDDLYFRGMRGEFGDYEDTVAYEMIDRAKNIFGLEDDTAYEIAWRVISQMKDRGGFNFIDGEDY